MNTYQPTDEQIEALQNEIPLGYDYPNRDPYPNVWEAAKGIVKSPAFQAIIRAAQAEAWATGMQQAIECADDTTDRFGNLYRLDWMNRMEFEQERNPYKEAADV